MSTTQIALEIVNSFIGFSIITVMSMYLNYIMRQDSYRNLVMVTKRQLGDFNYNIDYNLRKFWRWFNSVTDREIISYRYF